MLPSFTIPYPLSLRSILEMVSPDIPRGSRMLHWNKSFAEELGSMDARTILAALEPESRGTFYATRYGGHQFGGWSGQLGDGRAMMIGEVEGQASKWEVQLKGAGRTPFSRFGDGRAVLRSSLREYVCAEAMAHLRIPTTRSLGLLQTPDRVKRDMFYNGNVNHEPGAICIRASRSFIRFGHFELLAQGRDEKTLDALVKYSSELLGVESTNEKDARLHFFCEVTRRTFKMVTDWMRVGFIHAVMNTDNMSILGETIDYGPFSFLDEYTPGWTPNTSDQHARYAFEKQPEIVLWNLGKLAEALSASKEQLQDFLQELYLIDQEGDRDRNVMLLNKLGFSWTSTELRGLVHEWHDILHDLNLDYTLAHVALENFLIGNTMKREETGGLSNTFRNALYRTLSLAELRRLNAWLINYRKALRTSHLNMNDVCVLMRTTNPSYICRNYQLQLAIDDAEKGSTRMLETLMSLTQTPYERNSPQHKTWCTRRPDWAKFKAGASALSCSS